MFRILSAYLAAVFIVTVSIASPEPAGATLTTGLFPACQGLDQVLGRNAAGTDLVIDSVDYLLPGPFQAPAAFEFQRSTGTGFVVARATDLVPPNDRLVVFLIPPVPGDLAAFPSLALGRPQHRHQWHLIGPDGSQARIAHQPRLVTRSMGALRSAAVAGIGVVQLPTMMMVNELTERRLVRVPEGWATPREIVHAVFPSRRGLLPAVRGLIDLLAERFQALDED